MSNYDKFYEAHRNGELLELCCQEGLEAVVEVRNFLRKKAVPDVRRMRIDAILPNMLTEKESWLLSDLNKISYYLSEAKTVINIHTTNDERKQSREFIEQWKHKQDLYHSMCMGYRDRADTLIEEATETMKKSNIVGIYTTMCFECQDKLDELRREFVAIDDENYGMVQTEQNTLQYLADAKEEIMRIAFSLEREKKPVVYSNKPFRSCAVVEKPKAHTIYTKPKRN